MRVQDCCVIVLCVAGISCGSKDGSSPSGPTSPTPTPTPTAASLSISGPNTLRTGQTGNYTAVLTLSNGTQQNVTPDWTSDAASVLTINNSGQGNALAHGAATLVATTQGVSASTLVRVHQNYQGTWTGTHRIRVCDQRGDFVGVCGKGGLPPGTLLPFQMRLTQTAGSAVGTVELGQVSYDITGSIFDSRRFVGGGSATYTDDDDITYIERMGTLDVMSNGQALSGSLIVTIEAFGFTGNAYIESDLANVSRTSANVIPVRILSFSSVEDLLRGFRTAPN
jgi:hypothetical protein